MWREPTMREQVRAAATSLIRDAFEEDMDLWLPHRFTLKTIGVSYGATYVNGPQLHKYDDRLVDGIQINTYNAEMCSIRVCPFEELQDLCCFEYANPAFPNNALRFIENAMGLWLSWWDVFREDGSLDHLKELYPNL